MAPVKFEVQGKLFDPKTDLPMDGYSVICETGISDEHSLLQTLSVGPVAHTDSEGSFLSTFFAQGFRVPGEIEVNIEFGPGNWRACSVPVALDMIRVGHEQSVSIDLGGIKVDFDMCRAPTEK